MCPVLSCVHWPRFLGWFQKPWVWAGLIPAVTALGLVSSSLLLCWLISFSIWHKLELPGKKPWIKKIPSSIFAYRQICRAFSSFMVDVCMFIAHGVGGCGWEKVAIPWQVRLSFIKQNKTKQTNGPASPIALTSVPASKFRAWMSALVSPYEGEWPENCQLNQILSFPSFFWSWRLITAIEVPMKVLAL